MAAKNIWNNQYKLNNLDNLYETLQGKIIDICTVRSDNIREASLGTLFWMAFAANAAKYANQVNIYDFVTGNKVDNSPKIIPVADIAEIFEMPENVEVYRAEKVNTDYAWQQLYLLSEKENKNLNVLHPEVASAIEKLKRNEKPEDLGRMAEELAVFLQGYNDKNRIQFSAHEKETVSLIRQLPINPIKEYHQILTGIDGSEFRREKIPTISEFSDRLLKTDLQGEHYHQFFTYVAKMVAQEFVNICSNYFPMQSNDALKEKWLSKSKESGVFIGTHIPTRKIDFSLEMTPEEKKSNNRYYDEEWFLKRTFDLYKDGENALVAGKRLPLFRDKIFSLNPELFAHFLLYVENKIVLHEMEDDWFDTRNMNPEKQLVLNTIESGLNKLDGKTTNIDYVMKLFKLIKGSEMPLTQKRRISYKLTDALIAQEYSSEDKNVKELFEKAELNEMYNEFKDADEKLKRSPEEKKRRKDSANHNNELREIARSAFIEFKKKTNPSLEDYINLYDREGLDLLSRNTKETINGIFSNMKLNKGELRKFKEYLKNKDEFAYERYEEGRDILIIL